MTALPDAAPLVLLLRSPDAEGDDRYVQALHRRGFRGVCRPVLRFVFAGDSDFERDDASERLRHPESYAGLVFTSPRAVRVFSKTCSERAEWQARPAFAVGKKTAAELHRVGLHPLGAKSGNAAALASVIAKETSWSGRPLLFLCGNRRREELPRRLRDEGIPFEEGVVYETRLRGGPWLTDDPDWAVFFSPSGVRAVRQSGEAGWDAVRKVALGPTTGSALREAGWAPAAVAATPSPDALADALADARDQEGA